MWHERKLKKLQLLEIPISAKIPGIALPEAAQLSSWFGFSQFRLFLKAAFCCLGAALRKRAAPYFFQDGPHFPF
jgi:hypothetical protein